MLACKSRANSSASLIAVSPNRVDKIPDIFKGGTFHGSHGMKREQSRNLLNRQLSVSQGKVTHAERQTECLILFQITLFLHIQQKLCSAGPHGGKRLHNKAPDVSGATWAVLLCFLAAADISLGSFSRCDVTRNNARPPEKRGPATPRFHSALQTNPFNRAAVFCFVFFRRDRIMMTRPEECGDD